MKLYHFPMSPNTVKVMAVMNKLGIKPEEVVLDLTKGETHNPDYKAVNPNALIPTLVDGDFVLWESNAIMLYLAEKHDSDLLPKDLQGRAEVNKWLSWQLAHFGRGIGMAVFERVAPNFIEGYQVDEGALKKGLEMIERFVPVLDAHVADRKFVLGDKPSLADIALAASLIHWRMAKLPLEGYTKMLAWYDRVCQLDYFKDALPQMPAMA